MRAPTVITLLLVAGAIAGVACGDDEDSIQIGPLPSGHDAGTSASSASSSASSSSSSSSSTTSSSSGDVTDAGEDADIDSGDVDSGARAATPTFTTDPPQDGTDAFTEAPVYVTITTATPGATIYYTLDNTDPTVSSAMVSGPISVSRNGNTAIRAIAVANGLGNSGVALIVIDIESIGPEIDPPSATPSSSTQNDIFKVALTSGSANATICFTTDGTAPICTEGVCGAGSMQYNAAMPIQVSTDDTAVKAVACVRGEESTSVVMFTYHLQVADITATPPQGGMLPGPTTITLSSLTNSVTFHSTFGSTVPTCTTGMIGNQVSVTPGTTLQAIGCRDGFIPSAVNAFSY